MIGNFSNNYVYTKRMAEELILAKVEAMKVNGRPLPLVIIRPSIFAASYEEPVPGWTDSTNLLSGIYAIAGLGVLKDLPLNPAYIGDQIPVDFVCNQILAAVPAAVKQFRESKGANNLLITHACTSSTNAITWGETISILEAYWRRDPFDKALAEPTLRTHPNFSTFDRQFKLYNELPVKSWYFVTRFLGSRNMKNKAQSTLKYVQQVKELAGHFSYFMTNEWVFDNPSVMRLQAMVEESDPGLQLNFDPRKIQWKTLVTNHAYGIKKFVLKEETYLPSMHYADARTIMHRPFLSKYTTPWKNNGLAVKQVRSFEETKNILFQDEWVRREMDE